MAEDAFYMARCRALIEKKLGWGNTGQWQNQDFENLGEKIFAATNTLLSTSTLKRIWGKTRYESKPAMHTLNALAQFCGHENWRAFTAFIDLQEKETTASLVKEPVKPSGTKKWLAIAGILTALIITSFALYKKPVKQLHFEKLAFSNKPVTIGLPNTVIFEYDATHSNADSVFIQQSWDPRRRFKVDKQLHEYTSTYYQPGYYRAKLIFNDSIVKEQDVNIESEGWMGLIENGPIPVYLPKNKFSQPGPMSITEKDVTEQHIDAQKELPVVSIIKVDKTIDVPGDHILLLAELQNTGSSSNGICRQTSITLIGTQGFIDIPLCTTGCVGEIALMTGMKRISGKTNDLSGFGVDFSKPATVICETSNHMITISINNQLAYQGDFTGGVGQVVGAKIKFKGTGIVTRFELKEGN